ncbi:hypothetical protein COLO4_01067 [Corchorus olitorius]|uniref:Uncharacterized protein n=1 Tax=Corchorus olitorius TaxID=93759 RepID=A0A1R3L319_9ROSI|nr:hypothetical protein COLO4_01067 [Corchorus olitorius]
MRRMMGQRSVIPGILPGHGLSVVCLTFRDQANKVALVPGILLILRFFGHRLRLSDTAQQRVLFLLLFQQRFQQLKLFTGAHAGPVNKKPGNKGHNHNDGQHAIVKQRTDMVAEIKQIIPPACRFQLSLIDPARKARHAATIEFAAMREQLRYVTQGDKNETTDSCGDGAGCLVAGDAVYRLRRVNRQQ